MRRPSIFESLFRPPVVTGSKVSLRPKRLQDAANDYSWHRDTELCQFDAITPISISFEDYSQFYADGLRYSGKGYRFAIEVLDGGEHIGNCSYFNIDNVKREAEFGIMIGNRDYWSQGYGTDVILTLLNYIFLHTRLERIYLKTLNWNIRAQRCFKKCGFTPCGKLTLDSYNFIVMDTKRPDKLQKQEE